MRILLKIVIVQPLNISLDANPTLYNFFQYIIQIPLVAGVNSHELYRGYHLLNLLSFIFSLNILMVIV